MSGKAWIEAARPRTLPASMSPVIAGAAWAAHDGVFQWVPAVLCLTFAMLAQVASNMANDYYDYLRGSDAPDRVGPRRAVASGLISPRAMLLATLAVLAVACAVGLGLVWYGGWWLIPAGVVIALAALAYSAGPYPLSYHGLGDVTVLIFFGLVPVNLTYYVQAGYFTWPVLLTSVAVGVLAINILLINNYRDMEEDALHGKRTTVVLLGRRVAGWWYFANGLIAVACTGVVWFSSPGYRVLLCVIYLVLHVTTCGELRRREGVALNPLLGRTGLNLLLFTLLLTLALIL